MPILQSYEKYRINHYLLNSCPPLTSCGFYRGFFYFNKTGVYLGGGLDWNRFRWSGGKHQTDWGLGLEAGYAYFLSRTVTIEPAVYYKWRFNDGDMSRFGVKIGFGFYL